jgi:hypothetical protein
MWWLGGISSTRKLEPLVRQRPCTALILESESLLDKALVEAAKCGECFKDSIHTLRTFRSIVAQHLDKRLAEVKIQIDP